MGDSKDWLQKSVNYKDDSSTTIRKRTLNRFDQRPAKGDKLAKFIENVFVVNHEINIHRLSSCRFCEYYVVLILAFIHYRRNFIMNQEIWFKYCNSVVL